MNRATTFISEIKFHEQPLVHTREQEVSLKLVKTKQLQKTFWLLSVREPLQDVSCSDLHVFTVKDEWNNKKKESAIETVYLFSANLINEIHGKPLM